MITDFHKNIYWLQRDNNPRRQTAITFSYLGKLELINSRDLQECKNYLQSLLFQSILQNSVSKFPLVIGLTESGLVPSALMHQNLREQSINAQWLCSTRRSAAGICFHESHSHGPNHILPLPQHQPTELWFVEDEITTGQTILNLALRLCPLVNVKHVRLFALADTSTQQQIAQFNSIIANHGIYCSTHALLKSELPGSTENQNVLLSEEVETQVRVLTTSNYGDWHFARQRPALQPQFDTQPHLPQNLAGSLLVVGEAIDLGLKIIQNNPSLFLQHVTLSPWKIDCKNVLSRQEVAEKYYLYNFGQIQSPVYILSDPVDREIELKLKHLLTQKGIKVNELHLQSLLAT